MRICLCKYNLNRYNLVKVILLLLLTFLLPNNAFNQNNNLEITNIDFRLVKENVIINYDIVDSLKDGKYFIEMEVYNSQNKIIEAKTVRGDVNKTVEIGKNKIIIWEIEKDYPDFNDSIFITLTALQYIKTNLGKKLLFSTLYPGLGQYQESKKKPYLLLGIAGYGLVGTSLIFEKLAMDDYNKYKKLEIAEQRDIYFKDALKNRKISNFTLYSGIAVWVVNYGFIIYNHTRDEGKYLMKKRSGLTVNFHFTDQPEMALIYSINL